MITMIVIKIVIMIIKIIKIIKIIIIIIIISPSWVAADSVEYLNNGFHFEANAVVCEIAVDILKIHADKSIFLSFCRMTKYSFPKFQKILTHSIITSTIPNIEKHCPKKNNVVLLIRQPMDMRIIKLFWLVGKADRENHYY